LRDFSEFSLLLELLNHEIYFLPLQLMTFGPRSVKARHQNDANLGKGIAGSISGEPPCIAAMPMLGARHSDAPVFSRALRTDF
jgi:hypothetical protein